MGLFTHNQLSALGSYEPILLTFGFTKIDDFHNK